MSSWMKKETERSAIETAKASAAIVDQRRTRVDHAPLTGTRGGTWASPLSGARANECRMEVGFFVGVYPGSILQVTGARIVECGMDEACGVRTC